MVTDPPLTLTHKVYLSAFVSSLRNPAPHIEHLRRQALDDVLAEARVKPKRWREISIDL